MSLQNAPSVWLCRRRVRLKDGKVNGGRSKPRYATYWTLRWHGREIDPETGQPKLYSESVGRCTKAEAEKARRQKIADLAGGAALIDRPGKMTLGQFRAVYKARRAGADTAPVHRRHKRFRDLGEATIRDHDMTLRYLVHHFGEDRLIDRISPVDAEGFLDALEAGRLVGARQESARGRGLSEQTIRGHIRNAKAIFNWAHAFRLVTANPFAEYCGTPLPSEPNHYVSIGAFEALAAKASSPGWCALFALCRLAGLRRGEALTLPWSGTMPDREGVQRWVGVDWKRHRLCIVAVKTRIHREVPIVPRLFDILSEIRPPAPDDHATICGLSGNNLTRIGEKTAEAAELDPWPKFYQAMRSSCENDWKQRGLAEPTYSAWLGHSPTVSRKHYVSPTDDEFATVNGTAA